MYALDVLALPSFSFFSSSLLVLFVLVVILVGATNAPTKSIAVASSWWEIAPRRRLGFSVIFFFKCTTKHSPSRLRRLELDQKNYLYNFHVAIMGKGVRETPRAWKCLSPSKRCQVGFAMSERESKKATMGVGGGYLRILPNRKKLNNTLICTEEVDEKPCMHHDSLGCQHCNGRKKRKKK